MSSPVPALPMSSLLAPDAPLLSPVESTWPIYSPTADSTNNFAYTYIPSPPSEPPLPASSMLKMRQDATSAQLCLPTHQLFDLQLPKTEPDRSPAPVIALKVPTPPVKRSASPPPTVPKKRAIGERISTKDFVPPDVSGLTKREARLVKNRAAAFLSRQRKREEFEAMEVRVGELERENSRLMALTQNSNHSTAGELVSEIERLKAQLVAAQERERDLSAELTAKSLATTSVKQEAPDSDSFLLRPSHKSASLGLMVLLCALPSLLSMPTQSTLPTTFSLPATISTSDNAFELSSYLSGRSANNDFDWNSRNHVFDFETDGAGKLFPSVPTRKLEFSDLDSSIYGALSGLDISFDASPSEDGKIRVRIHHPSSSGASSRAPSPAVSSSSSSYQGPTNLWDLSSESDLGLTFSDHGSASTSSPSLSSSPLYTPNAPINDPFLGVGGNSPVFSSLPPNSFSSGDLMDHGSDFGSYGSEYGGVGNRRRVRIALKTMPTSGSSEGGEWEVEFY